jgi:hypothetical protein
MVDDNSVPWLECFSAILRLYYQTLIYQRFEANKVRQRQLTRVWSFNLYFL